MALFCLAAELDASVLLPSPAFPGMAAIAQAWRLGVTTYQLERDAGFAQTAEQVLASAQHDRDCLIGMSSSLASTEAIPARCAKRWHARAFSSRPATVSRHPAHFRVGMSRAHLLHRKPNR